MPVRVRGAPPLKAGQTPNTQNGDQEERRTDGVKLLQEQEAIPHESSMLLKNVVKTVIQRSQEGPGFLRQRKGSELWVLKGQLPWRDSHWWGPGCAGDMGVLPCGVHQATCLCL